MDGNGRWARARGLPRVAGHRAGTENLRVVLRAAKDFGIRILTLYAFSTENWQRRTAEVRALLALMEQVIDAELAALDAEGVQISTSAAPMACLPGWRPRCAAPREHTAHNDTLILNIAFNYGGRAEIVDAVRRIVAEGLTPEQVTEEAIGARLTTAGLPDPDLIIRTGGDMRLSNFLIWQALVRRVLLHSDLWPDFGREELVPRPAGLPGPRAEVRARRRRVAVGRNARPTRY